MKGLTQLSKQTGNGLDVVDKKRLILSIHMQDQRQRGSNRQTKRRKRIAFILQHKKCQIQDKLRQACNGQNKSRSSLILLAALAK